jgi:transposase
VSRQFLGVQITPDGIKAAVRPTGEHWSCSGGEQGIREIVEKANAINPEAVVIVARGREELAVAAALVAGGLPCAFVPPIELRDFARTIGKTGELHSHEAEILACFAELVRPRRRQVSKDQVEQLRALKLRRTEVGELIRAEMARLPEATPEVRRNINEHVRFLERSLRELEEDCDRAVRFSPIWR